MPPPPPSPRSRRAPPSLAHRPAFLPRPHLTAALVLHSRRRSLSSAPLSSTCASLLSPPSSPRRRRVPASSTPDSPLAGAAPTETCLVATSASSFIPAKVGSTKRQGESHRNLEDFDSISEQPQNHNPGVIPHKTVQPNWQPAPSRGPQRDLFTSPRRIRKNKGVQGTQQRRGGVEVQAESGMLQLLCLVNLAGKQLRARKRAPMSDVQENEQLKARKRALVKDNSLLAECNTPIRLQISKLQTHNLSTTTPLVINQSHNPVDLAEKANPYLPNEEHKQELERTHHPIIAFWSSSHAGRALGSHGMNVSRAADSPPIFLSFLPPHLPPTIEHSACSLPLFSMTAIDHQPVNRIQAAAAKEASERHPHRCEMCPQRLERHRKRHVTLPGGEPCLTRRPYKRRKQHTALTRHPPPLPLGPGREHAIEPSKPLHLLVRREPAPLRGGGPIELLEAPRDFPLPTAFPETTTKPQQNPLSPQMRRSERGNGTAYSMDSKEEQYHLQRASKEIGRGDEAAHLELPSSSRRGFPAPERLRGGGGGGGRSEWEKGGALLSLQSSAGPVCAGKLGRFWI
nr:unnamed protein product [Digitaria exilis]